MKLKLYFLQLVLFAAFNSFGQTGTHLNFDGVNDHIGLTNNFNLTNDFTFETWIKTGVDGVIVNNSAIYSNSYLGVRNGKLRYETGKLGYGGFILNSIQTVSDNVWHHVAITMSISSGLCKLYIDGAEDASASFGIYSVQVLNLTLGFAPSLYFNGAMDEVRIWNVIRTAAEINSAKDSEIQCNETGLVAYYQFNKGINAGANSGITNLTDVSANGHFGTLINFALAGTTSNWLAGSPITSLSSPPVVVSPIAYAINTTAVALTATPGLNGSSLLWYTNAVGGVGVSSLIPSTTTLGATTYYVSSVNANGCESEREKIIVNVNPAATHLNFDGINDRVDLGNNLTTYFSGKNTVTLEAWVKPTTNTGLGVIVGNYNYPANDNEMQMLLRRDGDIYTFWIENGLGYSDVSTPVNSVVLNTWQHISGTWDGTTMKIYIDGVLINSATRTGNLPAISSSFVIGYNSINERFTGSIDEVRIWDVARTAEQLNGSKNCELQGTATGLVAYYKFNQGIDAADNSAITTLTDATTNAYNGTLTNFTLSGTTSNFLAGSPVTTGSIIPSTATVTTPVVYNQGATATTLTATTGTNGNGLVWYSTEVGGTSSTTAPTPITTTAGNTSYYVSSSNANGCESARTEILVTVNAPATHLNFDGINDVISINNTTGVNFTLEAYIKTSTPSPTGNFAYEGAGILDSDYGGIANDFNFSILNNKLSFYEGSINLNLNGTTNIVDGNWHHVAVVRTANESVKLYLDGVLESQSATAGSVILNQNTKINIGASINSSKFFNGSMDEIRIWNRALPVAEIQNNMNCELPSPTTQTGLVAYYQFNQGFNAATNSAITTLTDSSASANNGTLTNFALTGTTSNWLAGSTIVTGTNCAILSSSSFDVVSNVNLYPNPTKGSVNIDLNNLTNVSVSVYDLNGRSILNQELSVNENSIDISNLQSGMYLFKIKSQEGETVKKVIKN